jgi:hypothetical protein
MDKNGCVRGWSCETVFWRLKCVAIQVAESVPGPDQNWHILVRRGPCQSHGVEDERGCCIRSAIN